MEKPIAASPKPFLVTLPKAGRSYFWCACGKSRKQPFCDGSHTGTGIEPIAFKAKYDGQEVLLCGCKQSKAGPFCDGSHNALSDSYELASAEEKARTANVVTTEPGADGMAMLEGGCYVKRLNRTDYRPLGQWQVAQPIGAQTGSRFLDQWQFDSSGGSDEAMSFGDSAVALFVQQGKGHITIAGRSFAVKLESGLYVAPGEAFSFIGDSASETLRLIAVVCPGGPEPRILDSMSAAFTPGLPYRLVDTDESQRTAMADRFYQLLVGDEEGGLEVTEFIGEIPRSRAALHRHMYEEAITILAGEGYMWTKGARAAVKPGDVIFLPMKQQHSLECTTEDGLRLMGAFYPSGSPAINY